MTDDGATLAPDDAFALLGNETRIAILRELGGADDPLSFSDLHDRVGLADSGQFNYHLDRLVGHFVRQSEAGYELRRAGERVVEAVLSGAVTDAPVRQPTEVDHPCPYCGAPVEVRFLEERVELFCTACSGTYERDVDDPKRQAPGDGAGTDDAAVTDTAAADGTVADGTDADDGQGYLGYHPLPPAGVHGRSAGEVLRAAATWGHLELMAAASGVCPRCAAALDRDLAVCDDHDPGDGLCSVCGRRHAVTVDLACTNCIYHERGTAVVGLASATPLLAFLLDRGYNPVSPSPAGHPTVNRVFTDYDEAVRSTDPLEVEFRFAVDGDELAITVDEDMTVLDVAES